MNDSMEKLAAGDRIELTFPARGDLIVLARLVTSATSARAGFDIEELEDLRLAVGELCLLTLQGHDARYGDLRIELSCPGRRNRSPVHVGARGSRRRNPSRGGRVGAAEPADP